MRYPAKQNHGEIVNQMLSSNNYDLLSKKFDFPNKKIKIRSIGENRSKV